jgi:hypothetical protein
VEDAKNNVIQFPGPRGDSPDARAQLVVTQWNFNITAQTVGPLPSEFRSDLNQAVANAVSQTMATFGHMTVKGISDMHFDSKKLGEDTLQQGFIIPLPPRDRDK